MPSPVCTVKDGSGSPQTTENGVDVTAGNTITIALAATTGVNIWSLSVFGSDEQVAVPTVTVNYVTKTATFVAPAAPWSLLFKSVVNNGIDSSGTVQAALTATFKVSTLTGSGYRLVASNETSENNQAFGWTALFNAGIREIDSIHTPLYTLDGSSASLASGDWVVHLPGSSNPLLLTKATPTTALAAGAIFGCVQTSYSPGATNLVVSVPGDVVPAAAFSDLGVGAVSKLQLASSNRAARQPNWSGGEIRLGTIDASGNVTIDPYVPINVGADGCFRPETFGAIGDGNTDDIVAFESCQTAMNASPSTNAGYRMLLGWGKKYYISRSFRVELGMRIEGHGGNATYESAIISAPGVDALIFEHGATSPHGGNAERSVLEHVDVITTSLSHNNSYGMGNAVWAKNTFYAAGKCIKDHSDAQPTQFWRSSGGTSANVTQSNPPGFTSAHNAGDTIVDGTITWTCEKFPQVRVDNTAAAVGDRDLLVGWTGVATAVTGASSGSGGKIRVTIADSLTTNQLTNGDGITLVGSTIPGAPDGDYLVTFISATTFDLTGTTYSSTGTATMLFGCVKDCLMCYAECTSPGTRGYGLPTSWSFYDTDGGISFVDIRAQDGDTYLDGGATFVIKSHHCIRKNVFMHLDHVYCEGATNDGIRAWANIGVGGDCSISEGTRLWIKSCGAGIVTGGGDGNGQKYTDWRTDTLGLNLAGSSAAVLTPYINFGAHSFIDNCEAGSAVSNHYGQGDKGVSIWGPFSGAATWSTYTACFSERAAAAVSITSIADNGSGKCRITCQYWHGLRTGDVVQITGITGGQAATLNNQIVRVTRITSTKFDVTAIAFVATSTGSVGNNCGDYVYSPTASFHGGSRGINTSGINPSLGQAAHFGGVSIVGASYSRGIKAVDDRNRYTATGKAHYRYAELVQANSASYLSWGSEGDTHPMAVQRTDDKQAGLLVNWTLLGPGDSVSFSNGAAWWPNYDALWKDGTTMAVSANEQPFCVQRLGFGSVNGSDMRSAASASPFLLDMGPVVPSASMYWTTGSVRLSTTQTAGRAAAWVNTGSAGRSGTWSARLFWDDPDTSTTSQSDTDWNDSADTTNTAPGVRVRARRRSVQTTTNTAEQVLLTTIALTDNRTSTLDVVINGKQNGNHAEFISAKISSTYGRNNGGAPANVGIDDLPTPKTTTAFTGVTFDIAVSGNTLQVRVTNPPNITVDWGIVAQLSEGGT